MSPTCNTFRTSVELELVFINNSSIPEKNKINPFTPVRNPPEGSLRTTDSSSQWSQMEVQFIFFQLLSSVLPVWLVMSRSAPGRLLSYLEMNKGSCPCAFCLSHIFHQNVSKSQKTPKKSSWGWVPDTALMSYLPAVLTLRALEVISNLSSAVKSATSQLQPRSQIQCLDPVVKSRLLR